MKKVLITGAPGFAASHLAKLILEKGNVELHGTKRVRSDMYRLEKLGIVDEIRYHLIEMTDPVSVFNVIKKVMPDRIYHLAAQDFVRSSWDTPHETFATNVNGTINLYQAIRQCYTGVLDTCRFPKVLVTSTSETYGYHKDSINEFTKQKPLNPYAISKLSQEMLAGLYSKAYGIPTVITRAFNLTGWGRNDPFVDSNFAKQIVQIKRYGRDPVIKHGNLEARRAFFDVKDAVRGYYLAMESKFQDGDVFCFGPEESTCVLDLINMMVELSGVNITLQQEESRMRPVDTPDMVCDASKAQMDLGWETIIPLRESLADLLRYWEGRV